MESPSKPSLFVSGSVATLWNEYLTILIFQLDHAASVVVSIFLTSRNHKDGAPTDTQYISNFGASVLVLLSADSQLWNNSSFTHKELSANASLNSTLSQPELI